MDWIGIIWPEKQFVVYFLIINLDGELFVEEVHPGSDHTSHSVDWDQVARQTQMRSYTEGFIGCIH